ncbi:MAG: hypothetical protein FJW38_30625 [Acidobacteria bacterium]|nr:hypothetical protein [Acidobacteriota bacterium]
MATAAQILANQANAQLSTGPKTTEGRARSAKNALKHGFNAIPALKPEDKERFLQFEADLRESIAPADALEEGAFLQLRDAAWRLEELRTEVDSLFAEQTESDPLESEDFENLQNQANRARAAAEMQLYRAIKALEDIQTTLLARYIHLTDEEHDEIPLGTKPRAFTYQMVDGFKFNRADREVFAATNEYMSQPVTPVIPVSATP